MKCAARCSSRSAAFSRMCRARLGRRAAPAPESLARGRDRRVRLRRCRIGDAAGRGHDLRGDASDEFVQRRALAEFDAARILPLRLIEIARQRDVRMRGIVGAADDIGRTPQQRRHRNGLVGGERDKGRVGAVLQQPPHQIGQQIAVAADRRIGAAGDVGMIFAELRVERFAHAVQALEFEPAFAVAPVRAWSRPSAHCGWRIAERSAAASASSCCAQAM